MTQDFRLAIGSDHAGFSYKAELIAYLSSQHYAIKDFGTHSDSSVDYPDFAHPLAQSVGQGEYPMGILICGSGNGVAITANKHQGVRAALCWNEETASLARQHNNSNVLCLPARFISLEQAKKLVDIFLQTPFEGGRHAQRVDKISL